MRPGVICDMILTTSVCHIPHFLLMNFRDLFVFLSRWRGMTINGDMHCFVIRLMFIDDQLLHVSLICNSWCIAPFKMSRLSRIINLMQTTTCKKWPFINNTQTLHVLLNNYLRSISLQVTTQADHMHLLALNHYRMMIRCRRQDLKCYHTK